MNYTTKD